MYFHCYLGNNGKPYKTNGNERFRWSVFGKGAPCPDRSRCRCVHHRAPRATRFGNAHFRSNALVAPSRWEAQPQADSEINLWENQQEYRALGDMDPFLSVRTNKTNPWQWAIEFKSQDPGSNPIPFLSLRSWAQPHPNSSHLCVVLICCFCC